MLPNGANGFMPNFTNILADIAANFIKLNTPDSASVSYPCLLKVKVELIRLG